MLQPTMDAVRPTGPRPLHHHPPRAPGSMPAPTIIPSPNSGAAANHPGGMHMHPNGPIGMPVPGNFAPFMRGMMMERLRSPGGFQAAAVMAAAAAAGQRMPMPALVPVAGGAMPPGMLDPRAFNAPSPFPPGFMFSQEDLDMVLYGYARNKVNEQMPGHALSGLRIGELSYGIDRILAGCSTSARTTVAHMDPTSLELPEGLELFQTTFAGTVHYGVFCRKTVIVKGTRFGPFQGKHVNTSEIKSNDDNSFMWEIFQESRLSHFVDGRGSCGSWMAYVNCARYAQEQNLIAVQTGGAIFYESCKDIPQGTELLVWYGDCYLQFMGIPVALKDSGENAGTQEVENGDGYQCERCGKVFAYRYYRDKHLKYTRCVDQGDRKFPCHLCTRSFEKRDRLRIHILHVHEKHRPHKCNVCGKSFSQSSSLNKHMRVHSGERPYKCVYCNKAFTASSILRTHIRQHSGEKPFKCKHCGKAFASHAAHDSHVRRTHARDRPATCDVCGKTFPQPYELKFHMKTHDINIESDSSCLTPSCESTSALPHSGFGDVNMNDRLCEEPIDVVGMDQEPLSMAFLTAA